VKTLKGENFVVKERKRESKREKQRGKERIRGTKRVMDSSWRCADELKAE